MRIALSAVLVILGGLSAHAEPFEATASSGPVKIVLRLASRKTDTETGLFAQVELQNIGKEPIFVMEGLLDPGYDFDKAQDRRDVGLFIEVRDSKGRELPYRSLVPVDGCGRYFDSPAKAPSLPKAKVDIKKLAAERAGDTDFTPEDLERRLRADPDFLNSMLNDPRGVRLAPGSRLKSPTWVSPGDCGERQPPAPPVRKGWAEIWRRTPWVPGRFKIRLVYDLAPSPAIIKINRENGTKLKPEAVRAATKWMEFVVVE